MSRKRRLWNGHDYEPVEAHETNGNLTYVERADGRGDWVAPHELDDGFAAEERRSQARGRAGFGHDDAWDGYPSSDRERFGSDY